MTQWICASAHDTELLSSTLADECPALVLAIEHVVKAHNLPSTNLSSEALKVLRNIKSLLEHLGMHLAVTAHRNHLLGQRPFHEKN